jgi:hypothetical protein
MKRALIYSLFLASLLFQMSCQTDQPQKAFSIAELENNSNNKLALPLDEELDLFSLTEELEKLDKEAIEKRLEQKGLTIMEASYLFNTLGLRYFQDDNFSKGMHYHKVAADQYLNPLAMLRLAHIYTDSAAVVQAKFPDADLNGFEQDFDKVYHYLHYGLNMAILTMEHFQDDYPVKEVNFMSGPLTKLFESRDSSILGDFDVKAAEEAMKKELPTIREKFESFYGLKEEG